MRLLAVLVILSSIISCSQLSKKLDIKKPTQQKEYFRVLWNKDLDVSNPTGNLSITFASPYIYNGILYQGTLGGEMKAYDLENGRELWSSDPKENNGAITGAANLYKDSVVYGNLNGRVFARNYLTGKLIYSVDVGDPVESRPFFYKDRAIIHTRSHKIVCLDATTGKILWAYKRSIAYTTTVQRVSEPIAYSNRILVGFADGHFVSLSLDDGVMQWEKKMSRATKFVDVDISATLYKNHIYVGSLAGKFSKLNINTGDMIKQYDYSVSRPPVIYDNHFYLPTVDGKIVKIKEDGTLVKEQTLSLNYPITSVGIWKGNLVAMNTQGRLYQLDFETLNIKEQKWFGSIHSALYGDFLIEDNTLAVMSSRSRLYVFR